MQLKKANPTPTRFKLPITQEQCRDILTACYLAEVEGRGMTFKPTAETTLNLDKVAQWLTDASLPFGLMLCGKVGNGKTTMLNAIKRCIAYCTDNESYQSQIENSLKRINATDLYVMAKDPIGFGNIQGAKSLAIDDLGCEPAEVLDYGNVITPAVELLSFRYERRLMTIITTNLLPRQIREKYGDRIADRFNEMMYRIVFNNETYRIR